MRTARLLRVALVTLLGAHVLVNGLACSDDHDDDSHGHAGAAGSSPSAGELVYEGAVTDEAAQSVLGVAASVDDAKAPLPTAPADGAALPGAAQTTFTWNASTARRPSMRLPDFLGPERSALAHGEPFTGVAYVLTFGTASNAQLVRVATSKTSYTPSDAIWDKLKAAGGPISLQITVARLENNLLVSGGGPYTTSKGISFTITP